MLLLGANEVWNQESGCIGKEISTINKPENLRWLEKIWNVSGKLNLSEEEVKVLTTAQAELEKAFVRSRRKWLEQGEKIERNSELSSPSKLNFNDLMWWWEANLTICGWFLQRLYRAGQLDEDVFLCFWKE